jgi:hypothetical protein
LIATGAAALSRPAAPAKTQTPAASSAVSPKLQRGSLPIATKISGAAIAPTPKVAFNRLSIAGPRLPKARNTRGLKTAVDMP